MLLSFLLFGQKDPIYQTQDGAIRGYDPVAYFTKGEPVQGLKAYSYEWKNATWRFSSNENLEAFKADPEKYAPQYGGYCSYAIAKGYTAKVDPNSWKIVDGKLYLNYNRSIQKNWQNYLDRYIKDANENWPSVLEEAN